MIQLTTNYKLMRNSIFVLLLLPLIIFSCDSGSKSGSVTDNEESKSIKAPEFNADYAFGLIEKQVNFGPRVPNTLGHKNTEDFLIKTLDSLGAAVQTQKFTEQTYDNEDWKLTNIIASINPDQKKRILLAAHWDSRKIADKDSTRTNEPIDGANDGASGVAVALEILRAIQASDKKPEVGIDIILFDGEDNGEPQGTNIGGKESWWCLGSQYWSKNKHKANYSAYYGILFDMVGAKNATFYIEGFSNQYAPTIVKKVWNTAELNGYGSYFIPEEVAPITDDHYFVNEYAKIPMIDIIAHDPTSDSFFPAHHHTHDDNLSIISKETLKAVGQTVLEVIYNE